jgi:hypothetical protein
MLFVWGLSAHPVHVDGVLESTEIVREHAACSRVPLLCVGFSLPVWCVPALRVVVRTVGSVHSLINHFRHYAKVWPRDLNLS